MPQEYWAYVDQESQRKKRMTSIRFIHVIVEGIILPESGLAIIIIIIIIIYMHSVPRINVLCGHKIMC